MQSMQTSANKGEPEMDETEYLLRSPANRRHLLEAIEYVNSGKPLIEVYLDDIDLDEIGLAGLGENDERYR